MLASSARVVHIRAVLWSVAAAVVGVVCLDGGSVALSTVQVTDASEQAARAAQQAVVGQPIDQRTAGSAYAAATEALTSDRDRVLLQAPGEEQDFRISRDGSVTVTVNRTAPTLLLARIPLLEEYADVTVTTHRASTS